MIREEYGHSYRQCPACKKESLPSGVVVCCQNKKCTHVIDTGKEPWVDIGPYTGSSSNLPIGFIKDKKPVTSKYQEIYQFVYSLSQADMVILDQVINDKRRKYGGG